MLVLYHYRSNLDKPPKEKPREIPLHKDNNLDLGPGTDSIPCIRLLG